MWDGGVTPVLEAWLVTRGDISRPVGAGKLGMEKAGPSQGKPSPAVTDAAREETTRIRLVFVNPNMTKATGRSRAALVMIG